MKTQNKDKAIQVRVPKGKIVVIPERCKGCGICMEFCPRKVLAFSKSGNTKGYHFPCVDKPKECIACNRCSLFCPDFAVFYDKENKPTPK